MKKTPAHFTQKPKAFSSGFTLIELLVVIIILAALVFIASSTFITTQMKARDAQRKSDLKQIGNALEAFYADYGVYPDSDSQYRIVGCGTVGNESACTEGNEFALTTATGGKTTYMVQMPADPRNGSYIYMSNGESYQLYARLENHRDPHVKNPTDEDPNEDNGKDVYTLSGCTADLGCNYGIASTNIELDPPIETPSEPGVGLEEI